MIHTINELNKFNKNSLPYTLSFYYCKRFLIEKGATYRSVVSDHYKIVYVLSGQARFITQKQSYLLGENECILCSRFNHFSISPCKDTKVYMVSFCYDAPLPFIKKDRFLHIKKAEEFLPPLMELYESENSSFVLDGFADAVVLLLLQKIARLNMNNQNQLIIYQKCCEYIETNMHLGVSVQNIADAVGYSREHLGRIIKAYSGKSLKELISFARMHKIKELAKNHYSSEQIAQTLGFASPELLRKYFRYQTGQTLASYTRQNAFMKNKE